MNYIFNFNLNDFLKNKDGKKIIIMGVTLLAVGIYCSTRRNMGINIFSWGLSLVFFYGAWLSLKELNQLTKYAAKSDIRRQRYYLYSCLAIAILLIVWPKWVNMVASIVLGLLLLSIQIKKYLDYRRHRLPYYGLGDLVKLLVGLMLIMSPLFLSKFIVSILSFIAILIGIYFINIGIKIENGRYN